MRTYSKDPKHAAFVCRITGKRPTDDAPVALHVTADKGTLYTTWILDGEVIYRRQYGGRNVNTLKAEISELIEGLHEPRLQGTAQFFPTLAENSGTH